jgi:copper oxidase (laccase) domain-containing protein
MTTTWTWATTTSTSRRSSSRPLTVSSFRLPGTPVHVVATDALEGDRRPPAALSDELFAVIGERAWSWLRQVHSSVVHRVGAPGEHVGARGDGLATSVPDALLVVFGADCAPVAFGSPEGVAGIAHAGWRGVLAGVVEATVAEMRDLGASEVLAWRGACVHPCCYAFDETDLEAAVGQLGPTVLAATRDGQPAFDLPAGVRVALGRAGAKLVGEEPACTACSDGWFSWRARKDLERTCVGVWRAA